MTRWQLYSEEKVQFMHFKKWIVVSTLLKLDHPTFILNSRSLSMRVSHWLLYLWMISDAEEVSNGQLEKIASGTPLCSMIDKKYESQVTKVTLKQHSFFCSVDITFTRAHGFQRSGKNWQ